MNVFDLDSDIVFMNIIAPQFIRDYFLEKFKDNYKMSSGETELIVPSVYTQNDYKRHMSINLEEISSSYTPSLKVLLITKPKRIFFLRSLMVR